MRFAAKLTAGPAAGRSPDSALRGQSNSIGRQEPIRLRNRCLANSRQAWRDTVRWKKRNKPGRIQLRPQNPKGPLKLFNWLRGLDLNQRPLGYAGSHKLI